MHFLFSLLRIKGLYMFRALLAYPQEVLHKRHLVYCVRVMSVGCYQDWSGTAFHSNPGHLAQTMMNLTCIREVSGRNFARATEYPGVGFSWFYFVTPGKFPNTTFKFGHDLT
jgi:hypothetical protein